VGRRDRGIRGRVRRRDRRNRRGRRGCLAAEAGGDGAGTGADATTEGGGAATDAGTVFALDAADGGSSSFSCAPASSFFDGGCGDPMTDPHNCGGCGMDCDGGACDAGACVPMPAGVLATGQLGPIAIAADGINVYWLTAGASDSFGKQGSKTYGAQVLSCAATGCGNRPTVLVTYPPSFGIGPVTGGTPKSTSAIAVDRETVYWTNQESVRACAHYGCGCAPVTIAGGLWQPPGVTASGGNVFWTEWAHGSPYTGTVSTCATAGCGSGPTVLATGQGGPLALTADDEHVYWADTYQDGGPIWECAGAGTIVQCAKSDCQDTRIVLASGRVRPSGIATDGTSVYWRDGTGDVYRCAVGGCGGSPTLVANAAWSNGEFDQPIAVAGARVYWAQQGAVPNDDWIASAPK
jgi:hypothetical protein